MKPFTLQRTKTIAEALGAKNDSKEFIAGGTNLVDLMKNNIAEPDGLVDINQAIPTDITAIKNGIRIGAMATNTEIALHPLILEKYPLLSKAILKGASPQIRNMASAGGNLMQKTRCPYFYDTVFPCNKRNPGSGCGAKDGLHRTAAIIGYSDSCIAVNPSDMSVALAALDAKVEVTLEDGNEETIAFKDFHRLPEDQPQTDNNLPANALIRSIVIPANEFHKNYEYIKLRDRDSYAFALVSVAAALTMEGDRIKSVRLASGGVAPKPWRWLDAESYLKGKPATKQHFAEAAKIACDSTAPLQDNAFKVALLHGAIETALAHSLNSNKK